MITDYNFIQDTYLKCNKFVAKTCKNRKYSHGHNHMKRVADLTNIIFSFILQNILEKKIENWYLMFKLINIF